MKVASERPLAEETATLIGKEERTSCAKTELEHLRLRTLGYFRAMNDMNYHWRVNRLIKAHKSVTTTVEGAVLASHQTADWIAISVNLEPELTQNAGSIHENEFRTTLRTAMELASKRLSSLIGKRITAKETLAYVDHELEDVLDRYAELAWRQPFEKT
jgi:hypothetical protein